MTKSNHGSRISFWHLFIAVLGIGLAGAGFWQLRDVNRQLEARQNQYMVSILNERRDALITWLGQIRDDVALIGSMPAIAQLVEGFDASLAPFGQARASEYLRLYANLDRGVPGDRELAVSALEASGYIPLHDTYQPWLKNLDKTLGFYDFFLINQDGLLIYSVEKEEDFGTNLLAGPWANTGLGRVVRAVLESPEEQFVSVADYDFYGASSGEAASFMATGILDDDGNQVGILAVQMPKDRLNAILNKRPGEQQSGRFYLTGTDGFLRSDIGDQDTLLRRRGISPFSVPGLGSEAVSILPVRRGVTGEKVVAAARTFNIGAVEFAIVAEFDVAVIHSWHFQQRIAFWLLVAASILIAGLIIQLAWMYKKPDQDM